jgi:hypothetical protein
VARDKAMSNFNRQALINNPWIVDEKDGPTSPQWSELMKEIEAEAAAKAAAKIEGAKRPKTGRGRR